MGISLGWVYLCIVGYVNRGIYVGKYCSKYYWGFWWYIDCCWCVY